MDSLRLRNISESRTLDRKGLAAAMLKAQGLSGDAPFDESTRATVNAVLAKFGRPADVRSWADAFEALTGDVDADGAADFDLDAARELSMAPPRPEGVRNEQTIVAGGDGELSVTEQEVSLTVRLVEDRHGVLGPFTGDVELRSEPVGELRLVAGWGGAQVLAGDLTFKATYPLELPGLSAEESNALIDRLLTATAPAGSPAEAALKTLSRHRELYLMPKAPADPGEAATWRAMHADPARVDAMSKKLTEQFGVRPLRHLGYINEAIEVPLARSVIEAARPQNGITPAYLYTVAMGEGLSVLADIPGDREVSGFRDLGVDTFGTRVADLKRRLLLPANFTEGVDYTLEPETNEKGEEVVSATFPDVKRGLVALNAMLADERRQFLGDARAVLGPEKAAKLTQDQINYFTYVYFNAGGGFGRKHLEARGVAAANRWVGAPPDGNTVARFNALQRVSTWRLIDGAGIFR